MTSWVVSAVMVTRENECFGWDLAVAAKVNYFEVEVELLVDVRDPKKVSDVIDLGELNLSPHEGPIKKNIKTLEYF